MAIRTKIRRIGTSLGVILPKRELDARRLREGDVIEISLGTKPSPRELFGAWKEKLARIEEPAP